MKRKATKHRKRLEGSIEALAAKDATAAQELADYRRNRSGLEKAVRNYLFSREVFGDSRYEQDDPDAKERAPHVEQAAACLCEFFLEAVAKRDGEALRAIAREVESFRRYPPSADPVRAHILFLKQILDSRQAEMSLSYLACSLNRPADAWLRKLANRLKFPFNRGETNKRKIHS